MVTSDGFIKKKRVFNLGLENWVEILEAISEVVAFQRLGMAP